MKVVSTQDAVRDLERRADEAGVKRKVLHQLANVHHSTWNRWGNGETVAPPNAFEDVERYLRGIEKNTGQFPQLRHRKIEEGEAL